MNIKPPLPVLAAIAALPPLAVDMYLPAIPGIAENLGTEISTIQNSLSIFLVGFGMGLLIFGPLSDRYGRRPLAMLGVSGFTVCCFIISISESAGVFLAFRLLQGFIGSAATVTVPAMIRDCYGKDTSRGMSSVFMIMLLAPLVAPLAGSLLLTVGPWEYIFRFLSIYGCMVLVLIIWLLPETRPDDKSGIQPSFLGNYKIILSNRSIWLDLLCFMLSALAFFTYLTSVSFIYITYFGVSETVFGILFGCTAASLIVANFINVRTVSRLGPRRMMISGFLTATLAAAVLVTVNLLELNVYWTLSCFILVIGGLGIGMVNADSLILIAFPNQASSASAVIGTLRFGFGACGGPLLAVFYNGTPVPPALIIFFAVMAAGILQLLQFHRNRHQTTDDHPHSR